MEAFVQGFRRYVARRLRADIPPLYLGEGPVWDAARERLLWVEISGGTVYEGALLGDEVVVRSATVVAGTVGAVLPAADGGVVVAGASGLVLVAADGRRMDGPGLIAPGGGSRLNDASCDPWGRLLVGSVALDDRRGQEVLWRVDASCEVNAVVTGLTCSNGIGFAPDGSTMYLVDSVPGTIRGFAYDVATGACGEARTVWEGAHGIPDGLSVDTDGNLWVAFFSAGEVRCLTPGGEVISVVEVPVPNPTCASFVGPGLDRLLITTAREKLNDEQLARWPDSGALFLAEVGVSGLPVTPWAGSTMRQTEPQQSSPTLEEKAT